MPRVDGEVDDLVEEVPIDVRGEEEMYPSIDTVVAFDLADGGRELV